MNRSVSLAGVAVGAAGTAAALAAMYEAMREVMVDNGGYCASGGPYQIADGHQCSDRTWVLTAAPFAGLALVALLVVASNAWSNDKISGLGAIVWGAMFGALGWNFLDLGINPPPSVAGGGTWIFCAVLFFAMALGGLAYGGMAIRDYFRPAGSPPSAPLNLPPLVKAVAANVPGLSTERPGMKLLDQMNTTMNADRPSGNAWVWLAVVLVSSAAGALAVSMFW